MKQNEDEPSVVVMGEEVTGGQRRHRNSGNPVWGVILVFSGFLFLFNTLGYLPWEVWGDLWKYWPILLILGGFHVILGNSLLAQLVLTVLSILLVGLVFLSVLIRFAPFLVPGIPPDLMYWISQLERMKP